VRITRLTRCFICRSFSGESARSERGAIYPRQVDATTVIGVPIDSVGRSGGTEFAPGALRDLRIVDALGAEDRGDLDVSIRGEERDLDTGMLGSADVLRTTETIRAAVAEQVSGGARPLLLGGCCAELPGALAGARDALGEVGLVHLDGHLDLYDGDTSPTGEAADMPISVALGLGPAAWVEACGGAATSPERTAIVGYRDGEESRRYGMRQPESLDPAPTHRSVEDLRAAGAGEAGAEVAAAIGASLACYNPEKDPDRACGRALVDALTVR